MPYSGYFGYVIITAATEAAVQSSRISVWATWFMVDVDDKKVTLVSVRFRMKYIAR
jgi:hypothetical protein